MLDYHRGKFGPSRDSGVLCTVVRYLWTKFTRTSKCEHSSFTHRPGQTLAGMAGANSRVRFSRTYGPEHSGHVVASRLRLAIQLIQFYWMDLPNSLRKSVKSCMISTCKSKYSSPATIPRSSAFSKPCSLLRGKVTSSSAFVK